MIKINIYYVGMRRDGYKGTRTCSFLRLHALIQNVDFYPTLYGYFCEYLLDMGQIVIAIPHIYQITIKK
jgi:hypothetical protein